MIHHDEICDLTASLFTEVCNEGKMEPHLQSVSGEKFALASSNTEDGARLDISVNDFWGGRCEKTFVDVKVFNEIEHSSFTPLIFSATGGMANEATFFTSILLLYFQTNGPDTNYATVNGMGMVLPTFLPLEFSNPMSTEGLGLRVI